MLQVIETLIRRFHGRTHEVAGFALGFFEDINQSHHCAHEIELLTHRKVELCGCQISIAIDASRDFGSR